MYRKNTLYLKAWKESEHCKPLILQGARKTGKTYSILEFGRTHYENVAYFNFETNLKLNSTFEENICPSYLIPILSHIAGQTIVRKKTLIVFDEIQLCERALTALKYFCEDTPDYHIIAAGSLLGISVNRTGFSFPVGKVSGGTYQELLSDRLSPAVRSARYGEVALPSVPRSRRYAGVCEAVCRNEGLYTCPPYTGHHSNRISQ